MLAERRRRTRLLGAVLLASTLVAGCGGSSGPGRTLTAHDVQAAFAAEGMTFDVMQGATGTKPGDSVLIGPTGTVILIYRSEACAKHGVLDPSYKGNGCPSGPPLKAGWPRVGNVLVEADDKGAVHKALQRLAHVR
jgi:predicted small secreted protein